MDAELDFHLRFSKMYKNQWRDDIIQTIREHKKTYCLQLVTPSSGRQIHLSVRTNVYNLNVDSLPPDCFRKQRSLI